MAENVSGLVKGTAKGYFLEILRALKECGYQVKAKLLDAQWLGVPQMRQRIIFMGIRHDLGLEAVYPKPLSYRYTVRDALPWIVSHGTSPTHDHPTWLASGRDPEATMVESDTAPAPTILAYGVNKGAGYARAASDTNNPSAGGNAADEAPPNTEGDDSIRVEQGASIEGYAIGREWDNLKPGEKSERYLNLIKPQTDQPCPTICQSHGNPSTAGVVHPTQKRKFTIAELKRICGFPDDFILTGTYAQQWERLGRAVPPVMMFHIARTIRDEVLPKCAG